MRHLFLFVLAVSVCVTVRAEESDLTHLLGRLHGVAELYRDTALEFTCKERIRYSHPGVRGRDLRFAYIYAYDPKRGLSDYRTRIDSRWPVRIEDYEIPSVLKRAYSWVFVFEWAKRDMYRFWLAGEEEMFGRHAVKVGFEPISPVSMDLNDWFGTAWLDQDTFQLLRVEALKADQQAEVERLEADLLGKGGAYTGRPYKVVRVVTDFSVEKNGMRFPGKVVSTLNEYRIRKRHDRREPVETKVYEVTQSYYDYFFFSVRTRDEIRAIVGHGAR